MTGSNVVYFTVDVLDAGVYGISAVLYGDGNYNDAFNGSAKLTVVGALVDISYVAETVVYGNDSVVVITVVSKVKGVPVSGNVTIDGVTKVLDASGSAEFNLGKYSVGMHNVVVL